MRHFTVSFSRILVTFCETFDLDFVGFLSLFVRYFTVSFSRILVTFCETFYC